MQINPPPVHPLPKVDIGELLLETVKAAPGLPVRLMDAVAAYAEWQSTPVTMIQPLTKPEIDEMRKGMGLFSRKGKK